MLAGAALADLAALFPQAAGVVRIMPNLPAALGKGITAVATSHPLDAKRAKALDALLAPLGRTARFDDDNGFDLMTAFAGSGPAFVYRMIDAYRAAGERLGLDADMAAGLSSALFDGSVAMLAQADGATPAAMAARVTSKGGTTQAGLDVLDAEGRLVALFTETLRAARDRGRELAELARTT
jgi:pyrroline-5-carboxylate reductase